MTRSPGASVGGERRGRALRDPGCEHLVVDRPVQDEGRHDPVMAQPGEEGERLSVAVRHLCREPLALAGPAAGSGHVGLDPGFASRTFGSSMKIRRLGSSRCWCAFQRTRNRATFGRIRSAAIRVFFDGLTGAPYKPPDRILGHPHPARRQLCRERPHREVGLLRKPGRQPAPGLARQDRATMPPDLAGPLTQAASLALPDPHRRGHRDPEALRPADRTVSPSERATAIRLRRSKESGATMLRPHHLVDTVNHIPNHPGTHIPIPSMTDRL